MISTLFGHIVSRIPGKTENLATDALGYILRYSGVARDAVQTLLAHAGMTIPGVLTYVNQVGGSDQAQPDVVGLDDGGEQRLVMEAKFWAGLTDHQPITYLKRLPKDGGVLLFIAPAARQELLWGELLRRCADAGITGVNHGVGQQAVRRFTMADGTHLAQVSWRSLLDYMKERVEAAGDKRAYSDLEQLQGLCDTMDSTAFLPLTSEELTDTQHYRRILQFGDIVDEVTQALVNQGVANLDNHGSTLTAVSTKGVYGRYMFFCGWGAYLSCDIAKWTTIAPTPLWLTIGKGFKQVGVITQEVREALAPLATLTPPRVFQVAIEREKERLPAIPLYVSPGHTKDEVVKEVLAQLQDIVGRLPSGKALAQPV